MAGFCSNGIDKYYNCYLRGRNSRIAMRYNLTANVVNAHLTIYLYMNFWFKDGNGASLATVIGHVWLVLAAIVILRGDQFPHLA